MSISNTNENLTLNGKKISAEEQSTVLRNFYERKSSVETGGYFREKYQSMLDAEKAFRGLMPKDIAAWSTGEDKNSNQFLAPMLTVYTNHIKRELSVNSPQPEIRGNTAAGDEVENEFKKFLAEQLSLANFGAKTQIGYHHGLIKGSIVEETVYSREESYYMGADNKIQLLEDTGQVDFIFYDPITVIPDPNANPLDWHKTARWCVVTMGQYTPKHISEKYGIDIAAGNGSVDTNDMMKQEIQKSAKRDNDGQSSIPIRKYYTIEDGEKGLKECRIYTIINDNYIWSVEYPSTGVMTQLPINICPVFKDPDNIFGYTTYDLIKYSIAMVSKSINQVADNNQYNNEFPLIAFKGNNIDMVVLGDDDDDDGQRRILEINPTSMDTSPDIRKMIHKFSFPDITNGANFLFDVGMQFISLITGVSPASIGFQSKQMRTTAEANIYASAMLTNSSDIVINVETGFFNPVIWDIFRIMRRYYDDFGFETIKEEHLSNYKNVRVANGSTLDQDKMKRASQMQFLLQIKDMFPDLMKQPRIVKDAVEAVGLNEKRYIKSPEELMAEINKKQGIQEKMMQDRARKEGFDEG